MVYVSASDWSLHILVIINFLTGQFIPLKLFSSPNQMYILENKFFEAFNFRNIVENLYKLWCCSVMYSGRYLTFDCCCYWPSRSVRLLTVWVSCVCYPWLLVPAQCPEKVLQLVISITTSTTRPGGPSLTSRVRGAVWRGATPLLLITKPN